MTAMGVIARATTKSTLSALSRPRLGFSCLHQTPTFRMSPGVTQKLSRPAGRALRRLASYSRIAPI
ncbi:MAG: hypothetical protein JWM58_4317 [Rhizobium sp.]|nr:hypothetical protein [Rhizobium sp.]